MMAPWRSILTGAVLLILAVATGTGPAEAAHFREFRDVSVSCTNAQSCTIRLAAEGRASVALEFERQAGPDAPLSLVIHAGNGLAKSPALEFIADGRSVAVWPVERLQAGSDGSYRMTDSAAVIALLDSIKNAGELKLRAVPGGRQGAVRFSLSGLVASLIFVDEVQGRLGAVDALHVKGSRPSPTAAVREITDLDALPAALRPEFTKAGGACAFFDKGRFAFAGGFVADLGGGVEFLALPCGEGGAYNQPFAFFAVRDGDAERLFLPTMTQEGPSVTRLAWNIDWNQSSRELTAFFRGRGLGDCGVWNRWRVAETEEGPAFVLIESRVKEDCDGNPLGGPENWPPTWPPARR